MSEVLDRPSVRQKGQYKVIGKSLPRIDGVGKVTGADKFAGDYSLPGTLIGKILRSPHAHARITKLDTSRAEAYPGVVAVLTSADVEGVEREPTSRFQNVVAKTQVLFAGQPIAAVAATTREVA